MLQGKSGGFEIPTAVCMTFDVTKNINLCVGVSGFSPCKGLRSFETSETTPSRSQHRVPENPNPKSHFVLFPELYIPHRLVTVTTILVVPPTV